MSLTLNSRVESFKYYLIVDEIYTETMYFFARIILLSKIILLLSCLW